MQLFHWQTRFCLHTLYLVSIMHTRVYTFIHRMFYSGTGDPCITYKSLTIDSICKIPLDFFRRPISQLLNLVRKSHIYGKSHSRTMSGEKWLYPERYIYVQCTLQCIYFLHASHYSMLKSRGQSTVSAMRQCRLGQISVKSLVQGPRTAVYLGHTH